MLVQIAVIPYEKTAQAQVLEEELKPAIEKGDMDKADELSQKLYDITEKEQCVFLSEDQWFSFLNHIRNFKPDFEAKHLLGFQDSLELLKLDLSSSYAEIAKIIKVAANEKGMLLQLPIEEDEAFV